MTDLRKAHAEHGSTSLRLAAEMALDALEWNYSVDLCDIENCTAWLDKLNATIPALRQALAHEALDRMVADNQRLGLYDDAINMSEECVHKSDKREHEPVCFLMETAWNYEIANWGDPNGFPVYTAPPKKEWVGLTHAEIKEIYKAGWSNNMDFAQAIEAKLKEKNT